MIKIGQEYKVTLDDCCIQGEFTSVLERIEYYENDGDDEPVSVIQTDKQAWDGVQLYFTNGVQLQWDGGVQLEDITEEIE